MTTSLTPSELVDAYHRAWTGGDVDTALTFLADEVEVHAPDERIRTRTDWRHYLSAFTPMLTAAPVLSRVVDGERVALFYFPQTATTTATLAGELFVTAGGRITAIHLAFDRLGYQPPPPESA